MSDEEIEHYELRKNIPIYLRPSILPYCLGVTAFIIASLTYEFDYSFLFDSDETHFNKLYGTLFVIAILSVLEILLLLSTFWSVSLKSRLTTRSVHLKDIGKATHIMIIPTNKNTKKELLEIIRTQKGTKRSEYHFKFRELKYIFDSEKSLFYPISYPVDHPLSFYKESMGLLDDKEINSNLEKFGRNLLQIPIPSFLSLFIFQTLQPFFIFQTFCVLLWCLDEYVFYCLLTLVMLIFMECTVVQQRLRNLKMFVTMTPQPYDINVYRNGKWKQISSTELLPGDVCLIVSDENRPLPCDLLVLSGSCVVNEAMLTGESTPTVKDNIADLDPLSMLELKNTHKRNTLYGGTYVINHHESVDESQNATKIDANGNPGALAFVLRNGFSTSQGKLMRTILFGTREVNANNVESLMFILFLLAFALTASSYVWIEGNKTEGRNKWKLFLECILIITSVIPPELPIQLTLAVNMSIISLTRLAIFCTEPFRIPFAGKVTICCFDKTGTLTDDELEFEGIGDCEGRCFSPPEFTYEITEVFATCHSLALIQKANGTQSIVGDPIERIALGAAKWAIHEDGVCLNISNKTHITRALRRFHFSSSLKRMSVIAEVSKDGRRHNCMFIKGAPEVIQTFLKSVPKNYTCSYNSFAKKGYRVLAVGKKNITASPATIKKETREYFECEFDFVGFMLLKCPLKNETTKSIRQLKKGSHRVIMITGDNALTACHVANEVSIVTKKIPTYMLTNKNDVWSWTDIASDLEQDGIAYDNLPEKKALCVSGAGLDYLIQVGKLEECISSIKVYARTNPDQKEKILSILKKRGHFTLMCGDGTNDVGALRQSHVGIALVKGKMGRTFAQLKKRTARGDTVQSMNRDQLQRQMETGAAPMVELGDASFASPFTSKVPSIAAVIHIIQQGRCTLVTTLQMYKILAINCLVSAFCLSVLYLDGVRFSDYQYTLQGLLIAFCLMFIAKSTVAPTLSKERPLPDIFNFYLFTTVLLQFVIHMIYLLYIINYAKYISDFDHEAVVDLEAEFEGSMLNTVVFVISLFSHSINFLINYQGKPFMGGLWENKLLLGSCVTVCVSLCAAVYGPMKKDFAELFEMVEVPDEMGLYLIIGLILNLICCFLIDRALFSLFGRVELRPI